MSDAGWLLLLLFLGCCALIVVALLWPSFRRATSVENRSRINSDETVQQQAYPLQNIAPEALETPGRAENADWLLLLLSALHLLFIGHSRGGKTTVIHEVATRLASQGNHIVVCDPDAAPGLWPQCEVHGYKNDLAAINDALSQVKAEVERRRSLRGEGVQRTFPPLYLVIDEYQDVGRSSECPLARPLVEDILRRGGKLDVHLLIGVQDKQVKTMGFEGQGDLRRNFSFIVEVRKDQTGKRWATVSEGSDEHQVETYLIPPLPDLDLLVEAALHTHSGKPNTSTPVRSEAHTATEHSKDHDAESSADIALSLEEIAMIVSLISSGTKTKTEIVKAMPGYSSRRHKAFSQLYDRLAGVVKRGTVTSFHNVETFS